MVAIFNYLSKIFGINLQFSSSMCIDMSLQVSPFLPRCTIFRLTSSLLFRRVVENILVLYSLITGLWDKQFADNFNSFSSTNSTTSPSNQYSNIYLNTVLYSSWSYSGLKWFKTLLVFRDSVQHGQYFLKRSGKFYSSLCNVHTVIRRIRELLNFKTNCYESFTSFTRFSQQMMKRTLSKMIKRPKYDNWKWMDYLQEQWMAAIKHKWHRRSYLHKHNLHFKHKNMLNNRNLNRKEVCLHINLMAKELE